MENKKELRKFGIIFGIAMLIMGTIHLWRGHGNTHYWFYGIGVFALISGIVKPILLKPLKFILAKILDIVKEVTTFLVLVILYYVVLTPISLIARLFKKEFLDLSWDKAVKDSYWIPKKTPDDGVERYERQY